MVGMGGGWVAGWGGRGDGSNDAVERGGGGGWCEHREETARIRFGTRSPGGRHGMVTREQCAYMEGMWLLCYGTFCGSAFQAGHAVSRE